MLELQTEIDEWASKTFDHTGAGIAAHLLMEAVELCKACGHEDLVIMGTVLQALRKEGRAGDRSFLEESADVAILVLAFAGHQRFDLETSIRSKMRRNVERTWGEKNEAGVIEHLD